MQTARHAGGPQPFACFHVRHKNIQLTVVIYLQYHFDLSVNKMYKPSGTKNVPSSVVQRGANNSTQEANKLTCDTVSASMSMLLCLFSPPLALLLKGLLRGMALLEYGAPSGSGDGGDRFGFLLPPPDPYEALDTAHAIFVHDRKDNPSPTASLCCVRANTANPAGVMLCCLREAKQGGLGWLAFPSFLANCSYFRVSVSDL